MPDVYAILGESNTRKSSTVRALTGVPSEHYAWTVATPTSPTGSINVYVQIMALQESGIDPEDFIKKIIRIDKEQIRGGYPSVNKIFIPLRISAFNKCPEGAVYLQDFKKAGWNIQPIVVLGAAALPPALPRVPTHPIPGSASMPANEIASEIRPLWNWL
jgi:hypothetical protein